MAHPNNTIYFLLIINVLCILPKLNAHVQLNITPIHNNEQHITITFTLEPGDFVYKEYLTITADHPAITLSEWRSNSEAQAYYDTAFKETKKVYIQSFSITVTAKTENINLNDAQLHVSYYQHSSKHIQTALCSLFQQSAQETTTFALAQHVDVPSEGNDMQLPKTRVSVQPLDPLTQYINAALTIVQIWWVKIIALALALIGIGYTIYWMPWFYALGIGIMGIVGYFLNIFLPPHITLWILAGSCTLSGIVCIYLGQFKKKYRWHSLLNTIGIFLVAGSIVLYAQAYQTYYMHTLLKLLN
ncbi:MAG: hypothetical protein NTX86_04340 [Candidatus Dependentiae bacterium]|nr:hypothetical protein [Candidatus Dependentiae bacterium]